MGSPARLSWQGPRGPHYELNLSSVSTVPVSEKTNGTSFGFAHCVRSTGGCDTAIVFPPRGRHFRAHPRCCSSLVGCCIHHQRFPSCPSRHDDCDRRPTRLAQGTRGTLPDEVGDLPINKVSNSPDILSKQSVWRAGGAGVLARNKRCFVPAIPSWWTTGRARRRRAEVLPWAGVGTRETLAIQLMMACGGKDALIRAQQ